MPPYSVQCPFVLEFNLVIRQVYLYQCLFYQCIWLSIFTISYVVYSIVCFSSRLKKIRILLPLSEQLPLIFLFFIFISLKKTPVLAVSRLLKKKRRALIRGWALIRDNTVHLSYKIKLQNMVYHQRSHIVFITKLP